MGDLIELKRGYDLPTQARKGGPFPIVSSSGITGYHAEAKVQAPGVVTGRYGTLGEVFYMQEDFWPLNTSLYVCDFKGNNPRFISYLLSSLDLARNNSAGAVPGLNRNHLHGLKVFAPGVDGQNKIVSILAVYDELIKNNMCRIEILEEIALRLYEEWFVYFRFPGHESVEFKPSKLGMIPEGWEGLSLGQCVELVYGKALKAQDRLEGDFPVYGSGGIIGTHSSYLVDGPGIIVGRKGNVGSVFWTDAPFYPIDTTYYVKTEVPLAYVFFDLQRQNFLNNDAAVPGLNREQAYSLPFLLPAEDVLLDFEKECEAIYGFLRVLERKNANLRAQRDLLLPKLISGEIDVSDIPMPN